MQVWNFSIQMQFSNFFSNVDTRSFSSISEWNLVAIVFYCNGNSFALLYSRICIGSEGGSLSLSDASFFNKFQLCSSDNLFKRKGSRTTNQCNFFKMSISIIILPFEPLISKFLNLCHQWWFIIHSSKTIKNFSLLIPS